MLPVDKGYTVVGTRVFPLGVALLMGAVGMGLVTQAITGGFRLLGKEPEVAEAKLARQRVHAVVWVSAGLLVDALVIEHVGFVFASTVLFALAARGFGSKRWAYNVVIGLLLSWPIYIGFTMGLGLSLPGLLKPWL